MKLLVIYGTRPEYLKLVMLIKSLSCKVLRVYQHEDILEPDLYYDFSLKIESSISNRLDCIGLGILHKLGHILNQNNITHILVQGDTSTVFYSALCAYQNGVKIIHLEAGMRTYDIYNPYPEEGYRQMISRITDIHLCPHDVNRQFLEYENVQGQIYVVGNTILDLVRSYNLSVNIGHTVYITFHRRENIVHLENFIKNLKALMNAHKEKEFVWILHPNRELQNLIKSYKLDITYKDPCNHREFLELVRNCFCLLTDSGGIQEESAFLGKPTIVLRTMTERDQIQFPYLQVVPPPYMYLKNAFDLIPTNQLPPCYVYGNGTSVHRIIEYLNLNKR
jgi:UDP-N-acetylglucosamine 2-epimerase (non-hydrolysing)